MDNIRFDSVGFGSFVKCQATSSATFVPIGQRPIVPAKDKMNFINKQYSHLVAFKLLFWIRVRAAEHLRKVTDVPLVSSYSLAGSADSLLLCASAKLLLFEYYSNYL